MTISTVVTSMKDEAPYILEWVAYHRAIGFDKIVILQNDSTDGTREILIRLQELGLIHYYENIVPLGQKPHSMALKRANSTEEVRNSDFVMVLDADEFLVIKPAPHTLDVLTGQMDRAGADRMVIPWRLFGSSHRTDFTDEPVIARFTESMDVTDLPKVGLKTLFRQDGHSRLAIHFPKRIMQGGVATGEAEPAWIDAGGQIIETPSKLTWNGGRIQIRRDLAEVAHFMIKSLDEYLLKIFRGDGLMNSNRHGIDYWRGADHNAATDLIVADNVAGFTEEYDRLCADPELSRLHGEAVAARIARLKTILGNKEVQKLRGILKRSTNGQLRPGDIAECRKLVTKLSPPPVPATLIEGEVPASFLVSVTTAGLPDSDAIAGRLFKESRRRATMFWTEKDFAKRPISSLVEGLKRAQKAGRSQQIGCRWFENFARVAPVEGWPLDAEIPVVVTRGAEALIAGYPAYVAGSKARHLDKPGRRRAPLRKVFTGAETPAETEALIAADMVEDPRARLAAWIAETPGALVLDLDQPEAVAAQLAELAGRGPGYDAVAGLLEVTLTPTAQAKTKAEKKKKSKAPAEPAAQAVEPATAEAAAPSPSTPSKRARKAPLRLFWFRRNGGNGINFGDDLGPLVVRHLTGRDIEWAAPADCDLASIGSILSQVSRDAARQKRREPLRIWGSGLIEPDATPLHTSLEPLALRGLMTTGTLGLTDLPTGDPGIFAADVVKPGQRRYRWGIVPHYSHRNSKEIRALAATEDCLLIDPTLPPEEVLLKISECAAILSSSLHGLIVADSYGIPCTWLNIASHKSHDFKFADYCSGVGRPQFAEIGLADAQSMVEIDARHEAFNVRSDQKDSLATALRQAA